jgi:hypothetical protein
MNIQPSDEARKVARRIVKDAPSARVKFGRTNGRECFHVYVPGAILGSTVYSYGEWETLNHPANQRGQRQKNETSNA